MAALIVLQGTGFAFGYSGEVYTVCRLDPNGDNYLSLRTCGASSCREKQRLDPGTFLLTMEPYDKGGWREVTVMSHIEDYSANGQTGWVFSRYICMVDMRD